MNFLSFLWKLEFREMILNFHFCEDDNKRHTLHFTQVKCSVCSDHENSNFYRGDYLDAS